MSGTRLITFGMSCVLGLAGMASQAHPGENRAAQPPPQLDQLNRRSSSELVEEFARRNRGKKASEKLAAVVQQLGCRCPGISEQAGEDELLLQSLCSYARVWSEETQHSKRRPDRGQLRQRKARGPRSLRPSRPTDFADFATCGDVVYRFDRRRMATSDLTVERRLTLLLNGCPEDSDLIVAGIQRALDVHDEWVQFGELLEAWRNPGPDGSESFYQALDQTAGTDQSVFFYDTLLDDFVRRCTNGEGKRWSRPVQQQRLNGAFLAYRQYRAYIEAVAYSLVLPPDIDLPDRLARYDYGAVSPGYYSLRHELDILLDHHKGDVAAVVTYVRDLLVETEVPPTIWGRYQPFGRFLDTFQSQVESMANASGLHTDRMGERLREKRLGLAELIRTETRIALAE